MKDERCATQAGAEGIDAKLTLAEERKDQFRKGKKLLFYRKNEKCNAKSFVLQT